MGAMTTPVVTGGCLMRFVLPSKYKTIEDAPVPTDPKVRLVAVPEKDMAVLRFRGKVTGNGEAEGKYDELVRLAAEKGLSPDGKWELHRFNPPFMLPFLRTNEVSFPHNGALLYHFVASELWPFFRCQNAVFIFLELSAKSFLDTLTEDLGVFRSWRPVQRHYLD